MKRFSLLALFVVAAVALVYTYAQAKPSSAALASLSDCGCEVCKCPDCNGEFCTCDDCECEGCGCAAMAKPLVPATLAGSSCCLLKTSQAKGAAADCGCEVCKCPDCNGEFCTCEDCECDGCGCATSAASAGPTLVGSAS